jgi:hypothetical protein
LNSSQIHSLKTALDKLRAVLIFYKNQEHEGVQKCIKEVISTLKIVLGDNLENN